MESTVNSECKAMLDHVVLERFKGQIKIELL
jgi:hypothetical protein